MVNRKLPIPQFCLDACCVNARGKLGTINQLEIWHANGVIELRFPEDAQREAEQGGDQNRIKKARSYWIPYALATTTEERRTLAAIERILFGQKPLSAGEQNDAKIVLRHRNITLC